MSGIKREHEKAIAKELLEQMVKENVPAVLQLGNRRRSKRVPGTFYVTDKQGDEEISKMRLRGRDHDVYRALCSKLGRGNEVVIDQSEIAENLGMKRQHVNRSLRRLIELGLVLEGSGSGKLKSYQLSAAYVSVENEAETTAMRQRQMERDLVRKVKSEQSA